MADVFQSIDDLAPERQAMIVERLEARAAMPQFVAIRERYLDAIGLPERGSIHELGCGTGPVCRAIASRPGFSGTVVGSDLSRAFVEAARRLARQDGLDDIRFYQADARVDDVHDASYDLVLAHTVISHVAEPEALVRQAIALARPGGRIVLHDGDYASMTFHTGAADLDREMPGRVLQSVVANTRVMRDLPGIMEGFDVELTHSMADVALETGASAYLHGFVSTYCPLAVQAGFVEQSDADAWLAAMDESVAHNRFFGYCNFVTYCFRKPA